MPGSLQCLLQLLTQHGLVRPDNAILAYGYNLGSPVFLSIFLYI